jgi:hypothetical protein
VKIRRRRCDLGKSVLGHAAQGKRQWGMQSLHRASSIRYVVDGHRAGVADGTNERSRPVGSVTRDVSRRMMAG